MGLKSISLTKWKVFTGLTLFYLVVSLVGGVYFTQSRYQKYLDDDLSQARSQIWLDGAETGEQNQTQTIFKLKSQRALEQINWSNPIHIFNQCQIAEPSQQKVSFGFPYQFSLDLSSTQSGDFLEIECYMQSGTWLVSSLLLSVFSIFLFSFQPRPLNSTDLKLLKQLQSFDEASPDLKLWKRAIQQFRLTNPEGKINEDYLYRLLKAQVENMSAVEDKVSLLKKASKPLRLSFSVNNGNVSVAVNDVVIPVSVTPAIYWLWYAKKRVNEREEGWVLNPPSNRPSQQLASELITLMENYGGHGRAISELKLHGLKAKTLDQNRNKIKDAVFNVLGESFVEQLGFESDKQGDNAQSIYRLKISPNAILING
ncbi:hypothetical protein [Vibrio sp. FJH11]